MSVEAMVDFLDSCWCARDHVVPCLVGPVGIGKTAAVNIHAKNVGANNVVTIIASQILPNEVSGITMPDADTKAMEIYDHFRLSRMKDGDILFFDELLEADQSVLKACLTLIESRELMSGRRLPDVQIVAATNPSIKPSMLKENIRQRFLFNRFNVDKVDTMRYIRETTGLDMSEELLGKLTSTGDEYNILTPRSLTKMATWISKATELSEAVNISNHIDSSWNSSIGSSLLKCWKNRVFVTKDKAKDAIRKAILDEFGIDDVLNIEELGGMVDEGSYNVVATEEFRNVSLKEMVETLSNLPEWENIAKRLKEVEIEEPLDSEDDENIMF